MLLPEPFIILEPGTSKVCRGCGIDQIAAPHTGHGDNRYFLIPAPETGEPYCPVCFFARHWQSYAFELHGQIVFSETPQSLISLIFYFRQFANKASLERTPHLVSTINAMHTEIVESSNRAVTMYLPDMATNLTQAISGRYIVTALQLLGKIFMIWAVFSFAALARGAKQGGGVMTFFALIASVILYNNIWFFNYLKNIGGVIGDVLTALFNA